MWQRFKAGMRNFMAGRHGSDQLNLAILLFGIVLWIASMATGIGVFYIIELVLYGWAIFRMFSRNRAARDAENMRFLQISVKVRTAVKQFFARLKNRKQYKYFKCPQCKVMIRLKRGVGEVTVTCPKCQNKFRQKA